MDPFDDESLIGFIFRTARRKPVASALAFAKKSGFDRLTNRPRPEWLAHLAGATGTTPARLEAISYGPLDSVRCRFNGVTLAASVLKARGGAQRKVCPGCMGEYCYHRGIWDLLFISACAVHSTELVDACYSCGDALRWKGLNLERCGCRNGGNFTSYVATPVDRGLMRATRMVYGLLGDARFGSDAAEVRGLPPFTDISDNQIIEFLFRGGLEMMGARLKIFSMEHPGEHAWNAHRALAHGLAAAEDWPQGFFNILDTMRRRSADTYAVGMRKNVIPVERWLARMGPGRGLVIRSAVDEYRAITDPVNS
jgi:hypothetical protein